jgi:hypothetical protein
MFKQTKGSARQHVKALTTTTTKQKSAGNSKHHSNVKAPTKKAMNNWKWLASESSDDTSSDKELKEWQPHKKTKNRRHKADEDIEKVDDAEESEEVEDDEISVSISKSSC